MVVGLVKIVVFMIREAEKLKFVKRAGFVQMLYHTYQAVNTFWKLYC
jgi:hypothetical protein